MKVDDFNGFLEFRKETFLFSFSKNIINVLLLNFNGNMEKMSKYSIIKIMIFLLKILKRLRN